MTDETAPYLSPGHRVPAIAQIAFDALLQVHGVEHAKEFLRWVVVDVCGEEWQEFSDPEGPMDLTQDEWQVFWEVVKRPHTEADVRRVVEYFGYEWLTSWPREQNPSLAARPAA